MKKGILVGGAHGIGKAILGRLVREGLRISVPTLHPPQEGHGGFPAQQVQWLTCDVRDPRQIAEAVDTARRFLQGAPDFLIYNAGTGVFKPLPEIQPEEWKEVLDVNLTGAYEFVRHVLPDMLRQERGTIIFIGSIAGKTGFASGTAYCASKFGLRGLAQALHEEVRQQGIRVSYIAPGSVATDFFRHVPGYEPGEWMLRPEEIADVVWLVLRQRDDALIHEVEIRPLRPPRS